MSTTEASAGVGGAIVGGSASGSLVKYGDEDINVGFGGISLGGEAGIGLGGATLGYSANLDVANLHTKQGIRANVGIDGGSNFTAGSGGVEVKAVGFGLSVGKKMGISTPLGGISIDFEETCNQQ
ncbi:14125_t:CDS:2 [Racocetra persica]|uniref:14125_t:CDS:1 n=1 Tax=Racocetra persica TaxID=160502 RepID=A0ACA9PQ03_9GLOM|nr:14125_t:CDS:2 [Racocetra persica]